MQSMRTIMAPVDFSQEATNSLIYAVNLAVRLKVKLVIVHVHDEVQRKVIGAPLSSNYKEKVQKEFEKVEHDYLYGRKLKYEFKYYTGNVAEIIRKAATELQADLIVMGRKGKGSIYEEQMGSITVSLLDHSPCAVLAIPGNCRKLKISSITLASDLSTNFPEHQIYVLNYIAESLGSSIRILKISQKEKVLEPVNGEGKPIKEKFDKLFKNTAHDFHEIKYEDLIEGLDAFNEHYNSDMMVLLKKNRPSKESFFGPRLSNVMTLSVKIPALIIPIDN